MAEDASTARSTGGSDDAAEASRRDRGQLGRHEQQPHAGAGLRQVRAVLDLAAAKGWLGDAVAAQAIAHRLGGMLYRLAGR